jgi:hypothetical protein
MDYAEAERQYIQADKIKREAKKTLSAAKRKAVKDDADAKKTMFRESYIKDFHETFSPREKLELERQEKELVERLISLRLRKSCLADEQKEKWRRIEKWYEEEATRHRWRTEFLKNREEWRS